VPRSERQKARGAGGASSRRSIRRNARSRYKATNDSTSSVFSLPSNKRSACIRKNRIRRCLVGRPCPWPLLATIFLRKSHPLLRASIGGITALLLLLTPVRAANLDIWRNSATMEDMSFATEQIARIETLLAENPGVKSVIVGNTTVTYEDLLKQYEYWKNLADREAGRRPGAKQINLSGF
jgi:hypothetical protein